MMNNAFSRSKAMFSAIPAAMMLVSVAEQQQALSMIGPYRSRGKGRGAPSRRFGNTPHADEPHQGKREMARRVRQMARQRGAG